MLAGAGRELHQPLGRVSGFGMVRPSHGAVSLVLTRMGNGL